MSSNLVHAESGSPQSRQAPSRDLPPATAAERKDETTSSAPVANASELRQDVNGMDEESQADESLSLEDVPKRLFELYGPVDVDIDRLNRLLDRNPPLVYDAKRVNADLEEDRPLSCGSLLHDAFKAQIENVVERILARGADPTAFCEDHHNALQCAASQKRLTSGVINLLTKDFTSRDKRENYINMLDRGEGWRATHHATSTAYLDDGASLNALVHAGADFKLENLAGLTPFQMAVKGHEWDVIYALAYHEFRQQPNAFIASHKFSYSTGCSLIMFDAQIDGFLKGFVLEELLPSEDNPLDKSDIRYLLWSDIRNNSEADNPVCAHGKISECEIELEDDINFMSITIPYFSVQATGHVLGRKEQYKRLLQQPKYCVGSDFNNLGFQCYSTLDEYCNPNLDEATLASRNRDQVLGRYQKAARNNSDLLITVPQLWIWQINKCIVAAGSIPKVKRYAKIVESLVEGWDIDEMKTQLSNLAPSVEPLITFSSLVAGILVGEAVYSLTKSIGNGRDSIFIVFEKSIHSLSSEAREYTKTEVLNQSMEQERTFILQIGDIREELSMIQRIVSQQEAVWRQFIEKKFPALFVDGRYSIPSHFTGHTRKCLEIIGHSESEFATYKQQISEIDADAQRVEDSIRLQLDLKSKHASLKEAHLTTLMSAAIIGFSLVTIIFTPLAFLASYLALSTSMAQQHQYNSTLTNGAPYYKSSDMTRWMITVEAASLAVTGFAVYLALRFMTDFSFRRFMSVFFMSIKQPLAARSRDITRMVADWARRSKLLTNKRPKPQTHNSQNPGLAEELAAPNEKKKPLRDRLHLRQRRTPQHHVESGIK